MAPSRAFALSVLDRIDNSLPIVVILGGLAMLLTSLGRNSGVHRDYLIGLVNEMWDRAETIARKKEN